MSIKTPEELLSDNKALKEMLCVMFDRFVWRDMKKVKPIKTGPILVMVTLYGEYSVMHMYFHNGELYMFNGPPRFDEHLNNLGQKFNLVMPDEQGDAYWMPLTLPGEELNAE